MRPVVLILALFSSGCAFLDPIDYAQPARPQQVTEIGGAGYGIYADDPQLLWRSDDHVHWRAIATFEAPIAEITLQPDGRTLDVRTDDGHRFDSADRGKHWQPAP